MGLFNFMLSSLFICNKHGNFCYPKIWEQASVSGSPAPSISNNIHGSNFLTLNISINVISLRGEDRIRLLHSLGTNSFEGFVPGKIIYNCNLNGKGKLVSYTRCMITETDIKILCNSYSTSDLLKLLDKSIFPMDRVKVVDETELWHVYATIGTDDENTVLNLSQFKVDNQNQFQNSAKKQVDQFKEYSISTDDGGGASRVYVLPGNDLVANNIPTQESAAIFFGHTLLAPSQLDISQLLASSKATTTASSVDVATATTAGIMTRGASEELWDAMSVLVGRPGGSELTDKLS